MRTKQKIKRRTKEHVEMTKAKTVGGVHTHTHE